jgi:DNA-binding CsgD family transcriptional regulator
MVMVGRDGERQPGIRAAMGDVRAPRRLTTREREVLRLVERGRTNLEIARRMGISRPTVARHLSNAMDKLGAESRTHAVVIHEACDATAAPGLPGAPGTIDDDGRAILVRLAIGRPLGAIARELNLSRRTADRRLAGARAALGVERTTEAVAQALRLGWLG